MALVSVQQWADRINRSVGAAAEAYLAVGRELIEAKEALHHHGEWERMFQGHPNAVERPVPFGVRTGQMLMAVAENKIIAELKTNHGSLLPSSWRTAYELTKVPEPVLRQAITTGRVRPTLQRKEAIAIRRNVVEAPRSKKACRRDRSLGQALEEGRGWMRRWRHLAPLAPVFDALRMLIETVEQGG